MFLLMPQIRNMLCVSFRDIICSQINSAYVPSVTMDAKVPWSDCVTKRSKLVANAQIYVPMPPPQAHLWTLNGLVEIVNNVPCFPEGVPMDIDKPYGPMPRHRYGSPRRPEHDNAPMEWMPFLRWAQVYRRSTVYPYRNMGMAQLWDYWRETCRDADKANRCRAGINDEGLEVLMSNRWMSVPVFTV